MAANEYTALSALRTKAFLGASLAGAAGGAAAGVARGGDLIMLCATGVLFVLLGGNLGGFFGGFLRGVMRWARGQSTQRDGYSPEGVLVLAAYGAFLGTVAAVAVGAAHVAQMYAGAGAVFGGAVASLLGNNLFILVRLMVLAELPDAARAQAIRRAAQRTREELLPPED